jgi:hypothetical protein
VLKSNNNIVAVTGRRGKIPMLSIGTEIIRGLNR